MKQRGFCPISKCYCKLQGKFRLVVGTREKTEGKKEKGLYNVVLACMAASLRKRKPLYI